MCDDIGLERNDVAGLIPLDVQRAWRKRSRLMSLDPLLGAARFLASETELRRSAVGFIGYGGTKPGDRVLILVDTEYDPRIPDAVAHALRERGAKVDVMIEDAGEDEVFEEVTEIAAIIRREPLRQNPRRWDNDHPAIAALHATNPYDLVIHGKGGPLYASDYRFEAIPWLDSDIFTGDINFFPRELHTAINQLLWKTIWELGRDAKVTVTDPEGTSASWTLRDGYFDGSRRSFKESPYWGHIMTRPAEPILPEDDATGVFAGTTNHFSKPFPKIEVVVENGRLQEIRGGGQYGDAWRDLEEETRDIQYPGFPRPGLFWLSENALGTHPKVYRPQDVRLLSSGGFEVERRRSGFAHVGIGTMWHTDSEYWAGEQGLPYGHLHIHLQMSTITMEGPAGDFVLVENGHLTCLDAPEVRNIASRFGDPDEILDESWIPTLPGINDEGSLEEYQADPSPYYYR